MERQDIAALKAMTAAVQVLDLDLAALHEYDRVLPICLVEGLVAAWRDGNHPNLEGRRNRASEEREPPAATPIPHHSVRGRSDAMKSSELKNAVISLICPFSMRSTSSANAS